jgi:hypothetical protein
MDSPGPTATSNRWSENVTETMPKPPDHPPPQQTEGTSTTLLTKAALQLLRVGQQNMAAAVL